MIWNLFLQNMNGYKKQTGVRMQKRMLRFCVSVLLFIILVCVPTGCSVMESRETPSSHTQNMKEQESGELTRLQVVTTIFPQYDFVRQIAGDEVSLKMLLKPGEETHSYEPTPRDIIAIQNADLFIYVGGENDEWVEDILDSPEMDQVHTLRLVDCVDTLEEERVEGMKKERHTWFGEEEQERDEHVWTSPRNVIRITERITEELTRLDNANQEKYETNRNTYIHELEELDQRFREVTETALQEGHSVLVFGDRFPFRYFVQEYGLDYYAVFPGCASDTEPSAAAMAFLIRKIKEENTPIVLKMELSSDQIARAAAEVSGAEVRVFYSCHNLTAEQFEAGESYLSMMQENAETLKAALIY